MISKNKIILVVLIIFVIGLIVGCMSIVPAKNDCKIKIVSDESQFEGGELSVKLTDLNKTPLTKEIINITITNKKGKVIVDDVVKTNSKGKAKLDLDLKKGKYTVNVTYGGNENYTGNNTTQKLTIKEKVVKPKVSQESSSSEWEYGTGAGASDDPNIHWKKNTKTGYTEYYDENTGRTWGGYNMA